MEVGIMLKEGQGVAQNMKEAARFLEKAVFVKDGVAEYELADLLEDPRNVDRDEIKAASLYHQAVVNAGHSGAQYRLARLLADDRVPQGKKLPYDKG